LQEWSKVMPLLTIEGIHGELVFPVITAALFPMLLNAGTGDAQLSAMWRRGLPPSARGALWSVAIGNKLGLTDADFDERVAAAAVIDTTSSAAPGSSCSNVASTADALGCDADEKRQQEVVLRAQIEMDLQRTMPRYQMFFCLLPFRLSVIHVAA
jgi:hypothetical protein